MIEKMTGLNVVATVAKDENNIDIDKNILEKMFKED